MELTIAGLREAEELALGTSEWLRVDQARIDAFAAATEDHQWIHVDGERAAASPFGGPIAHGYLTLSLIPRLLAGVVRFPDAALTVNYGVDRLRFLHPVPAGSEVRLHATLLSSVERSGGLLVRLRGEIEVKASGRRAMVAELLLLLLPGAPLTPSSAASPPAGV